MDSIKVNPNADTTTVNIQDDDFSVLSLSANQTVWEDGWLGLSGAQTVTFTVSLTKAIDEDIKVWYTVAAGGTPVTFAGNPGADVTITSGLKFVTIAAGSLTAHHL